MGACGAGANMARVSLGPVLLCARRWWAAPIALASACALLSLTAAPATAQPAAAPRVTAQPVTAPSGPAQASTPQASTAQPATNPVTAQPVDDVSRNAAVALGVSGLQAYEAGDYEQAHDKLEKAYAIVRAPTLGLWSARTLVKLGRLVAAARRYVETASLPTAAGDEAVQRRARLDAEHELGLVRARIPLLVIEVQGAPREATELSIDGERVTSELVEQRRALDPGRHVVRAVAFGKGVEQAVVLEEGERRTVVLELEPGAGVAGAQAQPWTRTAGWVAIAAGGAGIALGTLGAVLTLQKRGEMDDSAVCEGVRCAPERVDLVDAYNTRRTLALVGLIGGAALAGAGTALVLLEGRTEAPALQAFVGPARIGVGGSF